MDTSRGDGVGLEYPLLGTMLPDNGRRISRSTYLGMINANTQSARDAMFEYQFSHIFNRFIKFQQVFRWENSNDSNNSFYYDGTAAPGQVYLHPWWTQDRNTTTGLDTRVFGKFDTAARYSSRRSLRPRSDNQCSRVRRTFRRKSYGQARRSGDPAAYARPGRDWR